MNDEELKKLFDAAENVQPRDNAKAQAHAAAMAAFDAAAEEPSVQGNPDIDRHSPDTPNIVRSRKMIMTNRWMLSGLASAAVVVLGVMLLITAMPRDGVIPHDEAFQPTASGTGELSNLKTERQPEQTARRTDLRQLEEVVVTGQKIPEKKATPNQLFAPSVGGVPATGEVHAKRRPAPIALPWMSDRVSPAHREVGRDRFESTTPNPVVVTAEKPVSTFSVDVDTASYSFVRRALNEGHLPQKGAVRLEEMVNYFDYNYPGPTGKDMPFRANIAVIDSPWKTGNKLVDIGIKGYDLPAGSWPKSNIVFLLDVSGSMASPDKLPLVKQSVGLLLDRLQPEDTVSIVAYAGDSGIVLQPTRVKDKSRILAALRSLHAGGSTAGAAGIQQAYNLAESSFVKGGVNRVILATDGDFNVGITNINELKGFVERKRKSGVFLSVLGFGEGNYNDKLMQALAQNGNGVAAYIDTLAEAQKVLVDEATSTLFPIAKDVKIQVEFNPNTVKEYRLLGYETRMLKREDFNNDAVDAGDVGAGHTVTAIYEITPVKADSGLIDKLRYSGRAADSSNSHQGEYGYVRIRYKLPKEDKSRLISQPIPVNQSATSPRMRHEALFAASVAGFAQLLTGGQYTGNWSYNDALALATANKGKDAYGYRAEFIQLIRRARVDSDMPNQ